MTKNKNIIKIELILTCLLLFINTFLLWHVLFPYGFYFLCVIVVGFILSGYIHRRLGRIFDLLVSLAILAVFILLVISTVKSSFIYKEVVEIFVKKIFLALVIFSFAASSAIYLSYIQVLSAAVLISHALFITNYTLMVFSFVIAYLLLWVMIMRVKLYGYFSDIDEIKGKKKYPLFISFVFFIIAFLLAWALFVKFPIGKFDKFAILFHLEESANPEFLTTEKEKDFSQLEEELVDKAAKLISDSNYGTIGDKEASLTLFNKLINRSSTSLEVLQAEAGLFDLLNRTGPGIEEKKDDLNSILNQYLKARLDFNLSSNSKILINSFNMNPFNIFDKLANMSKVNKLNSSGSLDELNEESEKLTDKIDKKHLNLQEVVKIDEAVDDLRQIKLEELYRKKKEEIKNDLVKLEREKSKLETSIYAGNLEEGEFFSQGKSDFNIIKQSVVNDLNKLKESLRQLSVYPETENEIDKIISKAKISKDIKDLSDIGNALKQLEKRPNESTKGNIKGMRKLIDLQVGIGNLKELLLEIEKATNLDNFKEIDKDINQLAEKHCETLDKHLSDLSELSDIKLSIVNEHIKQMIGQDLKDSNAPEYFKNEIKHSLEIIISTNNEKEFKEQSTKTHEKLKNNKTGSEKDIKQLIMSKSFLLSKEKREEIKSELEKDLDIQLLDEKLKELKQQIDRLEEDSLLDSLQKNTDKLKSELEQLSSKGQLLKTNQDNQDKSLDELFDILSVKIIIESETYQEGENKQKRKEDSFEQLLNAEEMSEEVKELLKDLKSKIDKAKDFSEIKRLMEEIDMLENIMKDKVDEDDLKQIKQSLKQRMQIRKEFIRQNIKSRLAQQLDLMKRSNSIDNNTIDKLKRELYKSKTDEQLRDTLDKISSFLEQELVSTEDNLSSAESFDWQSKNEAAMVKNEDIVSEPGQEAMAKELIAVPLRIVMSVDTSVQPKAFFVSNKLFAIDVTDKCIWTSTNPNVAWIDQKGVIHAINKGATEITAVFRDTSSKVINVLVSDGLLSSVEYAIEREVAK